MVMTWKDTNELMFQIFVFTILTDIHFLSSGLILSTSSRLLSVIITLFWLISWIMISKEKWTK